MSDTLTRLTAALADRYRIEREVGAGGMATVYLAEDLRHGRQVALKVLRPELAATLGPERFFREIQVAARLQHPHILPLHDSGEAGGFLYFVMPYVEGESLRERLARVGELPVHDAVKILVEVVDALAYAHSQGVVHRDIKPDNVMLSGRHALVTDFGVAKAVSEATGRQQLTTAGVALGTPSYMAPEQAAADPNLDHRVDIYAVGAMAYELLTGRPPFTGMTSQQILAAHVTQAARSGVAAPAHLPAGAGGGHHAVPGQARGGPLPDRRGVAAAARAAGHAERRDDADPDAAGVRVAAECEASEVDPTCGRRRRARRRRARLVRVRWTPGRTRGNAGADPGHVHRQCVLPGDIRRRQPDRVRHAPV